MDGTDILLVEDNKNDAELTMRALRRFNLADRLHWVKDGAEALDYVFRKQSYASRADVAPKVVLLDLKLPKIDGIEVLKRVKGDPTTCTIPVVMLTSSAEERDVTESYRLGVNSYIVKPVDFTKFVDTVANAGLYWMVTNKGPR